MAVSNIANFGSKWVVQETHLKFLDNKEVETF